MVRNRFRCLACKPGAGGGGIGDFNYPDNRREGAQKFNEAIGQIPQPVLIAGICVLICVVLLLIVLFAWLRARGRFIFVDRIVRNRAAIVAPWKEFRGEGKQLLPVLTVRGAGFHCCDLNCRSRTHCAVYSTGDQAEPGLGFWIGLSLSIFVAVCLAFAWALFTQLMIPIMYRQRYRARLAFAQAVDLVSSQPGPILLYVCSFCC